MISPNAVVFVGVSGYHFPSSIDAPFVAACTNDLLYYVFFCSLIKPICRHGNIYESE